MQTWTNDSTRPMILIESHGIIILKQFYMIYTNLDVWFSQGRRHHDDHRNK